jgi:hypothetical protein
MFKQKMVLRLLLLVILAIALILILGNLPSKLNWQKKASGSTEWSAPVTVSTVSGTNPALAIDPNSNTIYILWFSTVNGLFYLSKSVDEGVSWTTTGPSGNTNVNQPPENYELVVDSAGNLHTAWRKYAEGGLYYSMWKKSTGTWTTPVRLGTARPYLAIGPDDTLHLITYLSGSPITYYRKPKGGSWSAGEKVADTGYNWPILTVRTDGVAAYYSNGTAYFEKKKTAAGWQPATVIFSGAGTQGIRGVVTGGVTHAVWNSNTWQLYYANDTSWKDATNIFQTRNVVGDIAVDPSGTKYVSFVESPGLLHYATQAVGQDTWTISLPLFGLSGISSPRMKDDNNFVYMTYDYRIDTSMWGVYFTRLPVTTASSPSPTPTVNPTISPSPTVNPSSLPTPSPTQSTSGCPATGGAKCWDCNNDLHVNILDFSCFISHYNQSY